MLTDLFTESIDRWLHSMVEDDFGGQGSKKIEAVVYSNSLGIFCGKLLLTDLLTIFLILTLPGW